MLVNGDPVYAFEGHVNGEAVLQTAAHLTVSPAGFDGLWKAEIREVVRLN